ncbi:MAG: hypothetical protein MJ113_06520 [Lachnospiraceae bacterium]|nr:hypothetical protein [Lachnospiraceae bacterium]
MSSSKKKANDQQSKELQVIKDFIEDYDVKKVWMAKKLEISRTTLNNYLDEIRPIPLSVFLEIKYLLADYEKSSR